MPLVVVVFYRTNTHWGPHMKLVVTLLAGASVALCSFVYAQTSDPVVARVLRADRDTLGGVPTRSGMAIDYAFAGMGLTGKVTSLTDVATARYVDTMTAGPMAETDGYDGLHAWTKEPSGSLTLQDGGEQRALAVNEVYRRANLWWKPDFSGARIVSLGSKADAAGTSYDVLSVTPVDGKPFEAWFGALDHRLARVVEAQGARTITTRYLSYRAAEGLMIPATMTVDDGQGAKYVQTLTLVSVRFQDAPAIDAFSPPKVVLDDFAIGGGAAETVLPFTLINNHIYGQAMVNGKGPYRFIFDTGGVNLVTPILAKELGLKSTGAFDGGGAGEGTMEAGFTKVDELKVAAATLKHQAFVVMRLDALSDIEGVSEQGMVGYETFRRFVTRVDYGAHTVTLIDPKHFDPKTVGTPIHFDFNDHNPEIAGTFEGIPAKFDIDTGARGELTLNKPFADRNGLRAKHAKGADMVDGWGIGGPSRGYVTRGAATTLGSVEVKNVVTTLATQTKGAFATDNYQGNIGGGILKRFVVTFDYEHQTMYLKPLAGPVTDVGTFDRAGMWFNVAGKDFKVADVTANGPADAAGIKVGDAILAIDGKPAESFTLNDLRRRLRSDAPGTVVRISLGRDSVKRDVDVTLRDLI